MVVSSEQELGAVGFPPGRPQEPLGHSDATLHGFPLFAPAIQRFPPQMPGLPPLEGQSAFVMHASAFALLQVSHRHLSVVNAESVQFGLLAVRLRVTVPVELLRSIFNVAMMPEDGGQSRLVRPKSGRPATSPFASHARPAREPPSQVPAATPSLMPPVSLQRGHGLSVAMPL